MAHQPPSHLDEPDLHAALYGGATGLLAFIGGHSLLALGGGSLTRAGLGMAGRAGLLGAGVDSTVYFVESLLGGFRDFSLVELGSRAGSGFASSILLAGFAHRLIASERVATLVAQRISVSTITQVRFSGEWWVQQTVTTVRRVGVYLVENARHLDRRYLVRVYTPVKTGVTLATDFLKVRLGGGDYGAADAAWSAIEGAGTSQADSIVGLHELGEPKTSAVKVAVKWVTNRVEDLWNLISP